jgi:hypothetical protein
MPLCVSDLGKSSPERRTGVPKFSPNTRAKWCSLPPRTLLYGRCKNLFRNQGANELRLLETAPTYPLRTVIPDYDDSSPEKPDREMAKQVDIETGISIRQIRRPELVPPWWRQFLSRRKRESSDGAQARRGIPMSFPD